MPFDTLKIGFSSHLGKDINKIVKELVKEGYLIIKPAAYGLQASLNKEKLFEIESLIKRILGYTFERWVLRV